ncbi:unnamed protein product, partial [Prorocentrum cordatum]
MVAALGPGATARPRRRRGLAAAAALAGVAAAGTAARALASALALGGPARPPAAARQAHACRVPACWRPIVAARRARGGDDEEVDVWKQAYQLEADRMDLISEQLKTEYERLGEVSQSLQQEYEGCILDLDSAPVAPEAEAAGDQWANAYTDLRRCNEQSELKVTEMRARLQGTIIEAAESTTPDVRGDWGPIRYKGITFKDIVFPRFFAEAGSKVYFIELEMPLGLKLEERTLAREGSRAVRAVEVAEVMPGASAAEDGRIRAGDIVRCITAPKRRVPSDEAGDEAGAFSEGEQTKAMLVIPTESSFPFEKVLEEIAENRNVDGYVGLVLERPLGDDEEQRQGEKGRVEAQPAGSTRGRPSPEPPAGLAARDGEVSLFGRPAPLRWAPGGRRAAAACAAAARGGLPPRPPAGRLAAGRAAGALRARAAGRRAVPGQAAQEAMDWVQRYIILPSAATSAPGPRARRPAGACTARSSWAPAPPRRRPAWAPRPSGSRPRALGSCTPPWSCALGCRTRDWEDFDVFDAYVQAWNRGRPFPAGTRGGTAVVPCEGLTDDQRQRGLRGSPRLHARGVPPAVRALAAARGRLPGRRHRAHRLFAEAGPPGPHVPRRAGRGSRPRAGGCRGRPARGVCAAGRRQRCVELGPRLPRPHAGRAPDRRQRDAPVSSRRAAPPPEGRPERRGHHPGGQRHAAEEQQEVLVCWRGPRVGKILLPPRPSYHSSDH